MKPSLEAKPRPKMPNTQTPNVSSNKNLVDLKGSLVKGPVNQSQTPTVVKQRMTHGQSSAVNPMAPVEPRNNKQLMSVKDNLKRSSVNQEVLPQKRQTENVQRLALNRPSISSTGVKSPIEPPSHKLSHSQVSQNGLKSSINAVRSNFQNDK